MKVLNYFFGAFVVASVFASCAAPAGEKAETGDAQEVTEVAGDATYTVDAAASQLTWEGAKVTGKHSGTMNISEGSLQVKEGALVGGSFTLDMVSIAVTDLEAGKGKEKLEGHLKTGDFFEVEKYPSGKFEITEAKKGEGAAYDITGNLTLKDVTKSVTFKADVTIADGKVTATAPQFTIDRTLWGITYTGMKDDLINNNMGVGIKLVAAQAAAAE